MGILVLFLLVLIVAGIISCITIVPEGYSRVVERFGAYSRVLHSGLNIKLPYIERCINRISLKEQVVDFPPQAVITKDNVTIQIDTAIFFRVFDEKLYTYGVERPINAMENITTTTLRNIIGDLDFEKALTSRDYINSQMKDILDTITDAWGIRINRVEIKSLTPPDEIRDAMEKQLKADRANREEILRAEGYAKAVKIRADADKLAAITRAEGMKESTRLLNEANITDSALKIQSLETWKVIADGQSTKIIIPPDMQSLFGFVESAKETFSDVKKEKSNDKSVPTEKKHNIDDSGNNNR